ALVHFLWQGALIGLVAFGLMRVPRFAATTRYTIGVAALAAMLAAPIATGAFLATADDLPKLLGKPTWAADSWSVTATSAATTRSRDARVAPAGTSASHESRRGARTWPGSLSANVGFVLLLWCAGVIVLSVRLAASWLAVRRLVREAIQPVSPEVH